MIPPRWRVGAGTITSRAEASRITCDKLLGGNRRRRRQSRPAGPAYLVCAGWGDYRIQSTAKGRCLQPGCRRNLAVQTTSGPAGPLRTRQLEPASGFEPPTRALRKRCSTPELRWLRVSHSSTGELAASGPWQARQPPRQKRSAWRAISVRATPRPWCPYNQVGEKKAVGIALTSIVGRGGPH
jgi:hypothetical protein